MALSERSRSALCHGLSDVIGDEEAVGEMMSYFPARDVDEPATRDFVAAQIADVRGEIHAATNRVIIWAVGTNSATLGLVLALTRRA